MIVMGLRFMKFTFNILSSHRFYTAIWSELIIFINIENENMKNVNVM